ncbi:MAG TPA: CHAT domain-containing protein [Caldilineaceae bacterium]|nr:CHAT domain-containing protein [Caldilineaceae bacterium]
MTPPRLDAMQFDLAVFRNEDGYFVRVLASPAGDTVELFAQPLLPRELEALRRATATLNVEDVALLESNVQLVQELGRRLFMALFPKSVGEMLRASYRMAYEARAQLRLRLRFTNTPELAMLPWEFIYDPLRHEFPALSLHSPLIRYTDLMHHIPPFKVTLPLRMLVIIATPAGYPAVQKEAIWHDILDSVDHLAIDGRLRLEQLRKPTLLDLQRRLREGQYHLLHFVTYASHDPFTNDGVLVLEDETGRARPVSGQHLGSLLRDHFPMRLATLAAIDLQSATQPNPQLAAAQSLLTRGVPAVVAVQSAFDAHSTSVFCQHFYSQIADFAPLDLALTESRRALEATSASAAWGLPALLTRIPDGQLFLDPATIPPNPSRTSQRLRTYYGQGKAKS